MPLPKDLKNSWKTAEEYLEKIQSLDEHPELEDFEASWEALKNNVEIYEYASNRHTSTPEEVKTRSPLYFFLDAINEGRYPTPEVMYAIGDCFNYYLNSNGKVELEDVFFGVKPEKGIGNYSAQRRRHERFSILSTWEGLERQGSQRMERKRTNIHELIEQDIMLRNLINEGEDIDSFLRSYRRWKNRTDKRLKEMDKEELEHYFQLFL